MRIPLPVVIAVLCLAGRAHALTVRALTLDDLVARADRIVHAQCVSVTPLAPPGALPIVEITLAVEETLKGAAAERLTIRQLGGRWRNMLPTCRAGDEVVLFLHAPSRAGLTSPVGMQQGHLRVVRAPGQAARITGDARIIDALARAVVPGASAALGTAARRSAAAPLEAALGELRERVGSAP